MQTEDVKRIGIRLLATTALGALLAAAPVSVDVGAESGVIALKTTVASAESGSGSDGDGGDDDSGSDDDGDRDNSGRGSDGDDDDDNSGRGSHGDDDDDHSSRDDDVDDSWVVQEIDGQIVRTRQRDGETRIRVRNIGEDEDLVRVRLRDGETEVRVRDPNTFEDVVRVRLRDQGDEIRVRDALTEEDLARLREEGAIVVDGIEVEISEDGAIVNVDDARVSADVISIVAGSDLASVQIGPDNIEAVRLPAEQTELLAREGWTVDSLDGDANGVLDADELGF